MIKNKTIKNFILSVVTASCVFSLTACGINTPVYSEEEIDKIGEYSALLLLGDDPGRLVDIEENYENENQEPDEEDFPEDDLQDEEEENVDETDVPEAEDDKPEAGQDIEIIEKAPEEEISEVTIEQHIGLPEGVTLTYKGYEWSKSLTDESGSFFYDAQDDYSFLIVNYNMYNASGMEQTIDFLYSGVTFTAYINQDKKVIATEMPIAEDMSTYLGKLSNGSGVDVILLFECDSSFEDNINSLKLLARSSEGIKTFVLE